MAVAVGKNKPGGQPEVDEEEKLLFNRNSVERLLRSTVQYSTGDEGDLQSYQSDYNPSEPIFPKIDKNKNHHQEREEKQGKPVVVILVGAPGTGKSTFCENVMRSSSTLPWQEQRDEFVKLGGSAQVDVQAVVLDLPAKLYISWSVKGTGHEGNLQGGRAVAVVNRTMQKKEGNFNEKHPVLFTLTKNHIFTLKSQSWYYSLYPLFCPYH
ncbi:hypothetical protein ACFX1Q_014891 [Malus domestica]